MIISQLIYVGCADEGGASFAIDALRTSAHPMTILFRPGVRIISGFVILRNDGKLKNVDVREKGKQSLIGAYQAHIRQTFF